MSERLAIKKTYKLAIGGAFPRSESGRSYEVLDAKGRFLANAAMASRKDVRDAVVAARKAYPGWSGATAYNRGQVLYRVAEMMEGRRAQFVDEVAVGEGITRPRAERSVDEAIDRWVWYAGWADKIAQVTGSSNPVAGPYFDFSVPEATGVVAVLAPQASSLLGLVSVLAPAVVSGNSAVVVASQLRPLPAITLAEVLANVRPPGWRRQHAHRHDGRDRAVARFAHGRQRDRPHRNRRRRGSGTGVGGPGGRESQAGAARSGHRTDWTAEPGLNRLTFFLETKTVWHPVGI